MKKWEKIVLLCIVVIFGYLYLQNNRYIYYNGSARVVDKWTKKCYYGVDKNGKLELDTNIQK